MINPFLPAKAGLRTVQAVKLGETIQVGVMMERVNRATVVVLFALLAGCMSAIQNPRNKLTGREDILGGAVSVAPPKGYCIDKDASQEQDDTAVVLMGRCDNEGTVPAAVLSLTVGAAGSAAALASGGKALSAYFTSDAGRAALSLDGKPENVTVLYASETDVSFVMHLEDRAKGRYWRAIAGARGRLITLSVTPHQAGEVETDTWRAVLDEAVLAIERANA